MDIWDRASDQKWFRANRWKLKPIDKESKEYSIEYDQLSFARFGDGLKFELSFSKPLEEYSPFIETPRAYLSFSRLGEFERFGWNAQTCVGEVLGFVKQYGPPWHPLRKNLAYRYMDQASPLTIERILKKAWDLASVATINKLLCDIQTEVVDEGDVESTVGALRRHMMALQARDRVWKLRNPHLQTEPSGLVSPHFVQNDREVLLPPLDDAKEVTEAAIAYVLQEANSVLEIHRVNLTLSARIGRETQVSSEKDKHEVPPLVSWTHAHSFDTLLGALWIQVCNDMILRTRLKECPRCFRLFNAVRSDQKFCSFKCRSATTMRRRYYEKKKVKKNREA